VRPRTLLPGDVVAGHRIEGLVGRGGMATVYRATRPGRDEPVALKLISTGRGWTPGARERFEREARLAAAVAHRGILPIYEAGTDDGRPFVVMKLQETDLDALLRELGRLDPERAVSLVSQVASALDAAHAHGLVHRDIKPSNVLLGEDDGDERAYVADFGVARAVFSGGDHHPGEIIGTVGYVSPEQIRGETVDRRTDVYALGCLLYECLTGRLPYARPNALAVLWGHLHDEPPAPSVLVPAVPRGLDEVVSRALAKGPEERFDSAGELAAEARAAVPGRARRERPPTPRRDLPTGTVTLLVAEGTDEQGRPAMQAACLAQGGVVVDVHAARILAAFAEAEGALRAAADRPARARVGIHTGTPHLTSSGYVGEDVRRTISVAAAAHPGQVLVSASTVALVGADGLRTLGRHSLEGFAAPIELHQLGDGSFPRPKTTANTNLPAAGTSFLGREAELHEAALLLARTRLLSVVGPGGVGKTRFALELATRAREERFADYEDGVFGCFLASLRDPALVPATVAQALSVPERPGETALEALAAYVGERRVLLLLDNVEHVLAATDELAQLLERCPALTVLATSREGLRMEHELVYELPPLAADESIALFCERAAGEPTQAVAELCARLEGLPLAIELAAARTSLLSPEQLLARLSTRLDLLKAGRDADPRQQTLRATIEWSHELLSPEAQELFARLSVFAGGCTLEAAEAVCDADLDALASLLDKSLLRRTGERFSMLETIRELAAELLARSGEVEELRRRHAEYFAERAERHGPDARGRNREVLDELACDYANFRAALQWADASGEVELLGRLAGALAMYWNTRGPLAEARAWLESAYGARLADDRIGARVARGAAALRAHQGDLAGARSAHERALELARRAGDRQLEGQSLGNLGVAAFRAGEYDLAQQYLIACAALARERGDELTGAGVAHTLGLVELMRGRLVEAERASAETLAAGERLGDPMTITLAIENLGIVALQAGRHGVAADRLREALRRAEEIQMSYSEAGLVLCLAAAESRSGDPVRGARLLGVVAAIHERTGGAWTEAFFVELERETRVALWERLGAKDAAAAFAAGAGLDHGEAIAYALEEPEPSTASVAS
jgi:predicted ATPase